MLIVLLLLALSGFLAICYHQETVLSSPWIPDPEAALFEERPLPPLAHANSTLVFPPLRAMGRYVSDAQNKKFKMASINWYGGSDELFIPGGLDVQHRSTIARSIRNLGFNSVRLPYSDEMVVTNPEIMPELLSANPDLVGGKARDIFEAVVNSLTEAGLAVIVNNHITHATWCCGADPCDAYWFNDHLGTMCRIKQSEEDWIRNWETMMEPHIHNPLVIGADLRNEVRGLWGTMSWERWARAAELAGDRLHKLNPNWLVIVGGTGSGNFLDGVRNRPIQLEVPDRVVYEAHVYGWSGWGSREGRYARRPYASFAKAMTDNWAYLLKENIAPVWLGEFGGPHRPSLGDAHYWRNLVKFMKAFDVDFAYWAINPRKPADNSRESYSLVEDDWVTPLKDYRMKDLRDMMPK